MTTDTYNFSKNTDYWDDFYRKCKIVVPSQFCVMTASEINERASIIDLGCGNGRDSLYFNSLRHEVLSLDKSTTTIKNLNNIIDSNQCADSMKAIICDFSSQEEIEKIICASDMFKIANQQIIYYSRFVLHSIDTDAEITLLSTIASLMKKKDLFYLEFRTSKDESTNHIYENHFRRYINVVEFEERVTENYRLNIDYRYEGNGVAKYKEEDPFVARYILNKM